MLTERPMKSLCLMVIIAVLLMGVCRTEMVADSFFSNSVPRTISANDINSVTGSVLRPIPFSTTSAVAYTRETVLEYETILTSAPAVRRMSMRLSSRVCFLYTAAWSLSRAFGNFFDIGIPYLYDKISSNAVIISYIHHQDGEKA